MGNAPQSSAFAFLGTAAPETVARLLAAEDQMVLGVILAHAPPTITAKILAYMGKDKQRQAVEMIRRGRQVPLELAERIASSFRRRLEQPKAPAPGAPQQNRGEAASTVARKGLQAWRPRRSDAEPVNAPAARSSASQRRASALANAIAQVRRLAQSGSATPKPATARLPLGGARFLNGEAIAAAILRAASSEVRKNIAANDPDLYNQLRGRMFVFDDLAQTSDEALALIFTAVDLTVAVQALRFGSPQLQERIFAAVSPRRAVLMREEMNALRQQRVRLADIEAAQQKVLDMALALQRQGKIIIDPADPDLVRG